jgi:oxygen-independent coproporphyrinogen-3 oxidase
MTPHALRPDVDLLRRLTRRGPRYTSYPTALAFDDAVGPTALRDELAGTRASARPVSLYFHIIHCAKLCWYCACTREISTRASDREDLLVGLLRELEMKAPELSARRVTQIHLGGGTPTSLPPEALRTLIGHVRATYDVRPEAEVSIEIDPRVMTDAHVEAIADAGFTRASLGVQDVDPEVQRAIRRVQPFEQTARAAQSLRAAGLGALNLDLIYGLPRQTLEGIRRTLDRVLTLEPERLAIYGYAHVPWAHPAQRLLERAGLPGPDARLEMLHLITSELHDAGYVHIGMDHFARPDDSLARALDEGTLQRNFQGYSTQRGVDIHGFGPSAVSATEALYAQNHKTSEEWRAALEAGELPTARGVHSTRADRLRREVIMELMCQRVVDLDALTARVGEDPAWVARELAGPLERLAGWEDEGLVRVEPGEITVTELGRHFLRNLARCFDAYSADDGRFSSAV